MNSPAIATHRSLEMLARQIDYAQGKGLVVTVDGNTLLPNRTRLWMNGSVSFETPARTTPGTRLVFYKLGRPMPRVYFGNTTIQGEPRVTSHANCSHPHTRVARAACRRERLRNDDKALV